MAVVKLKNKVLTLTVSSRGAELQSITGNNGTEYLWNGDPDYWADRALNLFPFCGNFEQNKYTYNETTYFPPKHGFAKDMEFTPEKISEENAVFTLFSDSRTRQCFPFEFRLRIEYTLIENTVDVKYTVENLSDCTMPFSIGAHEGYLCPGGIEEYYIEFEKPLTLSTCIMDGDELLCGKSMPILNNSRILPLTYAYCRFDTLIFRNTDFDSVTLVKKDGSRRIKIKFSGFPNLLLWTLPNAPFLCIEPWYGLPDEINGCHDITRKADVIKLEPNRIFEILHSIKIER